ncbi:hypothetical protein HJC23_006013 [Cyclotella cryptica]|uniref:Uncharacterized protein n=1 Tax=Cyclotella cryptica TaxID=29204 RepID=A0ABD3P2Q3_9STRA|eukprot:CCRYP_017881-RA/>CCRYP_017881-RA protein AED:0.10 eAED:0.10 QI:0/-1/0/1/-1/1/1/0/629
MNTDPSAEDGGFIRGLHMNHYVITRNNEYDQYDMQQQQHQQQLHITPSDDYTEALMVNNSRKSCARTTLDDVGYLCGCGPSPVDDVEVVYVKRNTTPTNSLRQGSFGLAKRNIPEQREDAPTQRLSGFISPRVQSAECRDEGIEVHADEFKYSSPRVGCMPASVGGFVDMWMPGCKPKSKCFFYDRKLKEEDDDKYCVNKVEKDMKYDEWKKQFIDMVKVPSFQTGGLEVAIESSADPGVVVAPIGQRQSAQSIYQPKEQMRSYGAPDPAESRCKSPDAPPTYQPSSSKDPWHSREREFGLHNDELERLRSEQQLLRKAREQLQSELEEFRCRRHSENVGFSGGGSGVGRDGLKISIEDSHRKFLDDAQRRQMDFKEMMVNQKFHEVMSVASPTSAVGSNASIGGGMNPNLSKNYSSNGGVMNSDFSYHSNIGRMPQFPSTGIGGPFHPSPLIPSQYWNSNGLSQNGMADNSMSHMPAAPMGASSINVLHSPLGATGNMAWSHPMSPSMMSGSTARTRATGYSSKYEDSTQSRACPDLGDANESDNDERLVNDLKLKNALMETEILRMKEKMSPRFNPLSPRFPSPSFGATTIASPASSIGKGSFSGNGILRPSSYNVNDRLGNQYLGM